MKTRLILMAILFTYSCNSQENKSSSHFSSNYYLKTEDIYLKSNSEAELASKMISSEKMKVKLRNKCKIIANGLSEVSVNSGFDQERCFFTVVVQGRCDENQLNLVREATREMILEEVDLLRQIDTQNYE